MKKSHVIAGLTALTAITAFSSAQAEERWPRWYIGLSGGYTIVPDQDVDGPTATKATFNNGYGLGGSIGYLPSSASPLLNALRFEVEVTFHHNDLDSVHLTNGTSTSGNGSVESTAYLVNMFYDFQTNSRWTPYIGGGVGFATLHLDSGSGIGNSDSSDDVFAYQGMAGIGYSPESIPNTQWSLGYRYLATNDGKFGNGTSLQYSTHNIEAGAKFRF